MKKKVVVLSGAGISAESGIATFRDSNGLWEQYRIEDVATPEAWRKDPELVTYFYNLRRRQVIDAQPNDAHLFFARLEKEYDVRIITQNIDDLHERAGSTSVLHLHGNIRQCKSSGPGQEKQYYPVDGWELTNADLCPEGFRMRPHVVWFGEEVPNLEKAALLVSEADVVVVVGTSLNVYPAAGLISFAKPGAVKILLDPNANELSVPPDFKKIASGAVNGVIQLKSYLGNYA